MYAIIKTGGKQIKSSVGETIWIEKINKEIGEEIVFEDIMSIFDDKKLFIGNPILKKSLVKGIVQKQGKEKKKIIFRTKAKSNWSRKQGHRQPYTMVLINEIILEGKTINLFDKNKAQISEKKLPKKEDYAKNKKINSDEKIQNTNKLVEENQKLESKKQAIKENE